MEKRRPAEDSRQSKGTHKPWWQEDRSCPAHGSEGHSWNRVGWRGEGGVRFTGQVAGASQGLCRLWLDFGFIWSTWSLESQGSWA